MKAWVYQDDKQVKKVGAEKASWYVGWVDPAGKRCGKSCGPGAKGKALAEKEKDKTHAMLVTGTYQDKSKKTWEDFKEEFEAIILPNVEATTRRLIHDILDHFERIIKPKRTATICTDTIDTYKARRLAEKGQKPGTTVSPATVNKELRHLRAVLKKAGKWGYLDKQNLPDFEFLREVKKLPRYVTPEHFAAIYQASDQARMPSSLPHGEATDWWRALLVFAYMTGWRISEIMALRRDDLDLKEGYAVTRGEDNKSKRDDKVKLHPVVLDHLKSLIGFDPLVFPWDLNPRTLYVEFARIQVAAGVGEAVKPPKGSRKRTVYRGVYGFHDLRRAFATQNVKRLSAEALQTLMRHQSYQTTQRYINMVSHMDEAVDSLHVPEFLKKKERA